jgi:hypothetical protein
MPPTIGDNPATAARITPYVNINVHDILRT